ncbi:MAG: LytTR family DNA-binding domain-containing protein [Oscillospiraceae bacterium]|nr:LytTR family DNA-binding domain-containing protein [Oscillospiraceae bacterium]
MNIAIGEDNAADAARIRAILCEYMEQNGYAGEIAAFTSGEELLATFTLGLYDVILLDIYMGEMNGITKEKKIREIDPTCALIFITSSADHALDSYSVRGNAYVIKPVDEKKMQDALFTCREIFLRNAKYIEIRVDRVDIKIPLVKIYYVEIFRHYASFYTADGEYKTRLTMEEIERQLGGKPFYRCHNSYLVNTNHIYKPEADDIVMKNGKKIPMRKNGRDEIRRDLAMMLNARIFEV